MKRPALLALSLAFLLPAAVTLGQVQKGEVPGISNFSRVDATIGCGGATAASALPELAKQGFKSVINLRLGTENGADLEGSRAAAQAAGLKYIHLPFNTSDPDPGLVDNFLAAVSEPSNQPVYIHCASANRVGAVWMIKRVVQDGWPVEKAQAEAEAIGLTNAALKTFASNYIATHKQ